MNVVGLIPARGGSRGKNLWKLGDRSLLAWTLEAARASAMLTGVVVSTESEAVAAEAARLDVPVLDRPDDLAADDTPMISVVAHALDELGPVDVLVLLQPTSPLRRSEHIDDAVRLLLESGADAVVSVVEVPHQFRPASLMRMDGERLCRLDDGAVVTRRQDKPRLYARNGPAVLACRTRVLEGASFYEGECRPLVMDPLESIDVDGPWDLELVEFILSRRSATR